MQAPSAKAVVSSVEVEDDQNSQREQCCVHTSGADATGSIMQGHRVEERSVQAEGTQVCQEATRSLASNDNSNTIHAGYYDNGGNQAGHCSYNSPANLTVYQATDPPKNKTFPNCEVEQTGNDPRHVSSESNGEGKLSDYFLELEKNMRTEECFASGQRTVGILPFEFGNGCLDLQLRYDAHTYPEFRSIQPPMETSNRNLGTNRNNHAGARPKERCGTQLSSNDQRDGKLDSSSNECSSSISQRISGPGSLGNFQDRKQHNGGCMGVIFPRHLSGISGEKKPSCHARSMHDPCQPEINPKVDVSARANRSKTLEDEDITNLPTRTNASPRQPERNPEVNVSARANRSKTLEDEDITNLPTRTNDSPRQPERNPEVDVSARANRSKTLEDEDITNPPTRTIDASRQPERNPEGHVSARAIRSKILDDEDITSPPTRTNDSPRQPERNPEVDLRARDNRSKTLVDEDITNPPTRTIDASRQPERNPEGNVSARAIRSKILDDEDITSPPTRTNDAPLGDVAEGNVNHNTEIHTVVETEGPRSPTSDVSLPDLRKLAPSNIEPFTEDRMQEGPKASGGLDVAGQNSHQYTADGGSQLGIPDSDCNSGDSSVDQDMRPSPEDAHSNSHSHGRAYEDILNNRSDDEPHNPLDSCNHEISLPDPDSQLHGGNALFGGNVGTRELSPSSIESRDEIEDLQTSCGYSVEIAGHNSREPDHRTENAQVSSRDTSNRQCSSGNMTDVRSQEFAVEASGQSAGRSNNRAYTYYLSDGSNPSVSCMPPSTRSRPLQRICERTWQPLETEAEPEISGPGRRCAACRGVMQYLFRRGRREICKNCFNEFERLKNQKSFSPISSEYRKVKRRCGHCSADRIQMNWLECQRCGCWLCSQCCMGSYDCIPKTF